ncbi:hypothetical protein [Chryseobacterium sp. ERMR1:04]|uniref:hypothetical protein n=1 Tax=Chryseobacterium sp. ERMR1:04 TaxID=1705393 RepID=UPI0006C87F18|nr:hypothetical protein [Chryseobacterium sp. ERMR1:04]
MGNEAVIEEVRFEDSRVGGDCSFRKVDDFFDDKETPYSICVGKFPTGTHKFHAALYAVSEGKSGLPFVAPVHFIEMTRKLKSVGFKLPKK